MAAQIHGNTRLEIGWTVGAAVILVFITVVTFIKLPGIKDPRGVGHRRPGQPGRRQRRCSPRPTSGAAEGRRRCASSSTASSTCGATSTRARTARPSSPTGDGRAGRHDRAPRHHGRRRRPLVVDPPARRQDGRDPRLHQQDLVQGDAGPARSSASAPSCAGATTPTWSRRCAPSPSTSIKPWVDRQATDIETARKEGAQAARGAPEGPAGSRRAARVGKTPRPMATTQRETETTTARLTQRRPQILAHARRAGSHAAGPRGSRRPTTRRSGSCTCTRSSSSSCWAASRRC